MLSAADWERLLADCAGELPEAWLAVREIAEAASMVEWEVPEPPEDVAFISEPVHSTTNGQVTLQSWTDGGATEAHDHRHARIFQIILLGDLTQQRWRMRDGEWIMVGERRGRAPDVLLSAPGETFSIYAPTGAVSLSVRAVVSSGDGDDEDHEGDDA